MKSLKKILAGMCVLLTVTVSSAFAVWEGNAGIAASSEFPGSGMYARSDMFPKNTIVEIQNLEKDITVRVVITGSSGVAGLVAVLSPETAAALNIRSGSVSRVRISIPSPVSERPAAGTVVTGSGSENTDPDVNPAVASSRPASPRDAALPLATVVEESSDPLVPVESPQAVTVSAPAAMPTEIAQTEIVSQDLAEPLPVEIEKPAVSETAPVVVSDTGTTISDAIVYDEPTVTSVPVLTETTGENAPVETVTPMAVADTESTESGETTDLTDMTESTDVAMVPAELVPPEASETPLIDDVPPLAVVTEPENTIIEPQAEIIETVPMNVVVVEPVAPPARAETIVTPSVNNSLNELVYVSGFQKGSYYIQIASYADASNALKIKDNYGKKYPVVFERSRGNSGDLVKVLIGPIQKDEYGAILERFKALGFRDAFVKKGQ